MFLDSCISITSNAFHDLHVHDFNGPGTTDSSLRRQYCTYNNKIDSGLSCFSLFWSCYVKEMESGIPLCRIVDAPACSLSKYMGHSVLCLLPCQLLNLILNRNHRMQQLIGLIVTAA